MRKCFAPGFLALFVVLAEPAFPQGVIGTLAGTELVFDGDGKAAASVSLGRVAGVALDPSGNLVIADPSNAVVLGVDSKGIVHVLAGNGLQSLSGDGGPATSAALSGPLGAAFDSAGNLYIADTANHRIRKVSMDGTISTVAGGTTPGFSGDGGPAAQSLLFAPSGVVVDSSGNLYINDNLNHRVRRITAAGIISTVAGNGQTGYCGDNQPALQACFADVEGLAVDGNGNLYIADFGNNRVSKVDQKGVITTVLGPSSLNAPGGVAVDSAANVYISDTNNVRIVKVTPQGSVSTVAGNGTLGFCGDGGAAAQACLRTPFGLVLDSVGNLYVADRDNFRIRKITAAGVISTVAGKGGFGLFPDGTQAVNASLFQPYGVSTDAAGNIYVADTNNNFIRRVKPDGTMLTIAGNGGNEFSGDGGPAAQAGLSAPAAVAVDAQNNVYIADTGNNRIRKITPAGVISTVAAGSLNTPLQVLVDAGGNLFIADSGNNRIRRVAAADGTISTVAGTGQGSFCGDGPATQACLNFPSGIAFDTAGNLYIADRANGRIRRLASGAITTVASGLPSPSGIAVDKSGAVYYSDSGATSSTNQVYKLAASGQAVSLAGNGKTAFCGDGQLATNACLNTPWGLAVDSQGDLLIADATNNRIRIVSPAPTSFQAAPATLAFEAKSDGGVTPVQTITLTTPVRGLAYGVSVSATSGGGWLRVSSMGGAMPDSIDVSADPTGLPAGSYQASIVIASPNNLQTSVIAVSFTVDPADAPKLSVPTSNLVFAFTQGDPAASQDVAVFNQGSGSMAFSATASGGTWLTLATVSTTGAGSSGLSASGAARPGQPATLRATVDVTNLAAGTYSGNIHVTNTSNASDQPADIRVILTVRSNLPRILLSQVGLAFTAVEGGGAPLPQSFGVLNGGQGSLSWSVTSSTLSGGGWLTVPPATGTVSAGVTDVPLTAVTVNTATLPHGEYYGQIQIHSPGAENDPQTITVLLTVLPAGSNPGPQVAPTGLIFSGVAGSSPSSQNVFVSTVTTAPVQYTTRFVTSDGGNWLATAPASASVTPNQPQRVVVQPDFTNLEAGVQTGEVHLVFDDGSDRTVNVVAILSPGAGSSASSVAGRHPIARASGSCTASSLSFTFNGLASGFSATSGQPVNLQIAVANNCGQSLAKTDAVGVYFSNGDASPQVKLQNGFWTGTWIPGTATSQVTITVNASQALAGGRTVIGTGTLSGAVKSATTTPRINLGALTNAASLVAQPMVAPGGLITLIGGQLADAGACSNIAPPYPTQMGGTQVMLDGNPLALLCAGDSQINAQVPFNLIANTQHQLLVQHSSTLSVPQDLTVAATQPAIFTVNFSGTGQGVILGPDGLVKDPSAPAAAGDLVMIYCTGLGFVSPTIPVGAPPQPPTPQTQNSATVTICGQMAQPVSTALAPGLPGVYQVGVIVPTGCSGNAVPVVLTSLSQTSPPVTMAVQ